MSKLLYITANPKSVQNSYGLTVGEEFLKEYTQNHPNDIITKIDLYNFEMSNIDTELANFMSGIISQDELMAMDKKNVQDLEKNVSQFIEHDKYVFISPLWNLGIPAILKTYFDNISISGRTFKYTQDGPVRIIKK